MQASFMDVLLAEIGWWGTELLTQAHTAAIAVVIVRTPGPRVA
jgi:hypothetical protein